MSVLDNPEFPGIAEKLGTSDRVKRHALEAMERDDEFAALVGGAPRADVQRARSIIANAKGNWIEALADAVKAGTVLPAVLAGVITLQGGGEEEGALAPGA